jgi:hypothetical protein
MPKPRREISLNDDIRYTEKWTTSISWAAPIDNRLRALVELAIQAGEPDNLSRSEVLAALVLAAAPSGLDLREKLSTLRTEKVRATLVVPPRGGDKVVTLESRRPGRLRATE